MRTRVCVCACCYLGVVTHSLCPSRLTDGHLHHPGNRVCVLIQTDEHGGCTIRPILYECDTQLLKIALLLLVSFDSNPFGLDKVHI